MSYEDFKPPAKNPCGSCPYRKDVPSGVWDESEYVKLVEYDEPKMFEQPSALFMCHQDNGCLCAGWVGTHDMENQLSVRLAAFVIPEVMMAAINYTTAVPLFASGKEAADHGMRDFTHPSPKAISVVKKLEKKRGAK